MSDKKLTACNAAVFVGSGQPLRIQSLDIPELQPSEALVRIEMASICGSDLHTIAGRRKEAVPSILGHEAIGSIERMGSPPPKTVDGVPIEIGDRVTWSVANSCFACSRCLGGLPQKCKELTKYGHELAQGEYALSGAFSEFIRLRSGTAMVRLPDHLPARLVCPVNCATATVSACLRQAPELSGKSVLIIGAGMLGLTATAMAESLNAAKISVIDTLQPRLELAKQYGATATHHLNLTNMSRDSAELQQLFGSFDVVLEFSGLSEANQFAVDAAAIGGTIVLAGTVSPVPAIQLLAEHVVRRCLTIKGVHNYAPEDLVRAVQFLEAIHLPDKVRHALGELVSAETFRLADINSAVAYAQSESRPLRVAVCP